MATAAGGTDVITVTGGEVGMAKAEERDQAFDEFVLARGPQLRRAAYLIVRDWHTAEDVVQTALIKVYLAWSRIERHDNLNAYARRAVVNAAISVARRPRREIATEHLPETATAPDQGFSEAEDDPTAILDSLSPMVRAVVALRFLEDLSVAEVAGILGLSQGTVKSYTSRGLENLRRASADDPAERTER